MGDESSAAIPMQLSKHAKFLLRFLHLLPARMASHDNTRSSIVFFAVCGLDVLNSLHMLSPQLRKDIIDWLYGGLVVPRENEKPCGGFMGCRAVVPETHDPKLLECMRIYQWGHLAMTYTSVAVLATLSDDLSRLDRQSIVDGVAAVQRPDGSFSATIDGSENDMRFVYCAAAICHMLDYWGDVNKDTMFQFIKQSLRYDNGFSQHLEGESHGGTTFCALAALQLSGQLERLDKATLERIKRWLVFRQVDGFQGRPNKPVDTCYSFWIGASLQILNGFDMTDFAKNSEYIMSTQDSVVGGFAKWPQSTPDPYHTYLGICGLSFASGSNLAEVMPSLNMSMAAYRHLQQLHDRWRGGDGSGGDGKHVVPLPKELQERLKLGDTAGEPATTNTSPLISAQ